MAEYFWMIMRTHFYAKKSHKRSVWFSDIHTRNFYFQCTFPINAWEGDRYRLGIEALGASLLAELQDAVPRMSCLDTEL